MTAWGRHHRHRLRGAPGRLAPAATPFRGRHTLQPPSCSKMPRPALPIAVVLTCAIGIMVTVGVLMPLQSSLLHPLSCIDAARCTAPSDGGFLTQWTAELRPPLEVQADAFRMLARIGVGLTLLLLAVIAVNLGTHLFTRSLAWREELAVRMMVGATPRHLMLPLAAEARRLALVAVVFGSIAGVGVAWLMRRSWPLDPAPWVVADGRSLSMAVGIVLLLVLNVTLTLIGPALAGLQRNLHRHLNTGARGTDASSGGLLNEAIAVLQVASALVLTVSSALLLTAFLPSDRGDITGRASIPSLAVTSLMLTGALPAPDGGLALQAVLEPVRAVPGVMDTSLTSDGASQGMGPVDRVTALCPECGIGSLPKQQTSGSAQLRAVSPGFFGMMQLGMLAGRDFADADAGAAPRVAVVSRAFALRFFPGGDPIDKEVRLGDLPGQWYRVIGIVEDHSSRGLGSAAAWEPVLYLSALQLPPADPGLLVRMGPQEDPVRVLSEVNKALAEAIRPHSVLTMGWATLQHHVQKDQTPLRWFGTLFALLGGGVTLLATGGLYGLMSQRVAAQRREIGIRMAVGANERDILAMVMRRSIQIGLVGLVCGVIPLGGIARFLELRFEGVDPWNPLLFAGATALVLLISIAASYRPARAATRVDPVVAMRA